MKEKFLKIPTLAFVGGLILRIYLSIRMPIWIDEKFTIKLLGYPWWEVISGNLDSGHPPGYNIFLKTWSYISLNTIWLRLSTLIFYILNFFLLYQIGIKHFDKKVGQFLVYTYAFSGYFLIFDWQLRMYTGLLTFILISLLLFGDKLTTKNMFALFAVGMAGLFFDYGFVFFFLPLIIWSWIEVYRREKDKVVIRAVAISTSLLVYLLIWGPYLVSNLTKGLNGILWVKYFTGPSFLVPYFLGSHSQNIFTFVFIGLVVYGILLNFFKKNNKVLNMLLFISSTSLIVSLLISWLFVPFFHVRSLQIVGVMILIFYANGISRLFDHHKLLTYIIMAMLVINALIVTNRLPIRPGEFLIAFP